MPPQGISRCSLASFGKKSRCFILSSQIILRYQCFLISNIILKNTKKIVSEQSEQVVFIPFPLCTHLFRAFYSHLTSWKTNKTPSQPPICIPTWYLLNLVSTDAFPLWLWSFLAQPSRDLRIIDWNWPGSNWWEVGLHLSHLSQPKPGTLFLFVLWLVWSFWSW